VAAGVRRALIANQVLDDARPGRIQRLMRDHAGLRVVFLVDSPHSST
jgi:D-serine dehydratase